jgi:hypothetical protein
MFSRRLFSLIFTLVLVLSSTGVAMADAPKEVGGEWCNFWFGDVENNWYLIEGQGKSVYNEKGNIYNLSCQASIDFSGVLTWEDFCVVLPGSCKTRVWVLNNSDFYHDVFDENGNYVDTMVGYGTLIVRPNGEARWNAEFSLRQCLNGFRTNSVTLELPAGFWGEGAQTYTVETVDKSGAHNLYTVRFDVSANAPIYNGQVRLGLLGLTSFFNEVYEINPTQDTFIQATIWAPPYAMIYLYDYAIFTIDDNPPITIEAGPVHNLCADQHYSWYLRTYGPKY